VPFILKFWLGQLTHVKGDVIFLRLLLNTWTIPSFEGVGWRIFGSPWTMLTHLVTFSWDDGTILEECTYFILSLVHTHGIYYCIWTILEGRLDRGGF
jgi:hypothetical protein